MTLRPIGNRLARQIFLDRHALAEQPAGSGKGGQLLDLIERLGFVQLDSINTVGRAHDMILRARRTSYRPRDLKRLYEAEKGLFEHWTHDAAVIPMAYYPHWHLRFHRDAQRLKDRWKNWRRDGFEQKFDAVLSHVREHGPVSSSDLGEGEKKGSGGWWDWHPSKTALEYLWRSGALSVVGRDGFQKRYDLTERFIEEHMRPGVAEVDEEATVDWLCNAALDRLGFATPGEIAAFWDTVSPAEARAWCDAAVSRGNVEKVSIECATGAERQALIRPETFEMAGDLPTAPGRMRVLSPFDPMLRDRARAERLFGFHYRIEVFVPEAKRRFGYYVFPLLEKDRMVGRIDMKAQRDKGVLQVRALWPERGARWSSARQGRLEAELERVRCFAGLERVRFLDGWLRDPV